MDTKKLRALVQILEGTDVSFFEWKSGDERWTLRRGPAGEVVTQQVAAPPPAPAPAPAQEAAPPASAPAPEGVQVCSPFVGTFYRAPSPGMAPFVDVGSRVSPGDALCIVEAMKLMNEIEAEAGGVITAILVRNGDAVEYGQPLFEIAPASAAG